MKLEKRIGILRNCTFLAGAAEGVLSELAEEAVICPVTAGVTLLVKGDPGSAMYFIASGTVRVHDGDVVLAQLGDGEVFGEMAVLDSDVRSASVTAETDCTLLSLERDDLWRVISGRPDALKGIIAAVLQRERQIVQDVTSRAAQVLAFEKELEIGRRIQADFLPDRIPQAENWEISASFEAAREVAGDFYDVFELQPDRRLAIVIGDVCDKGVGAALFMTLFRSLIRATCQSGVLEGVRDTAAAGADQRTRQILLNSAETTNRYIATTHSKSSMFASVFFGVLDPASGELLYINGGHESPMIFAPGGGHRVLEVTGGVLGLFPSARFSVAATRLEPGELLFAYTDGVNEAKNERNEQFSDERIVAAGTSGWTDVDAFLRGMQKQIRAFRGNAAQSDDITMLAVRNLAEA